MMGATCSGNIGTRQLFCHAEVPLAPQTVTQRFLAAILVIVAAATPAMALAAPPPTAHRFVESTEMLTREALGSEVQRGLKARDFQRLEMLYAELHGTNQLTPSGLDRGPIFYNPLKYFASNVRDPAYWRAMHAIAAEWRGQFPQSVPARLFGVYLYRSQMIALGGYRDADKLGETEREELTAASSSALQALYAMQEMAQAAGDPEWFRTFVATLPYSHAFSQEALMAHVKAGSALYPNYFEIVSTTAFYANEQWGGGPDTVEIMVSLATEVAVGQEKPLMYARIYWHLNQMVYDDTIFTDSPADWRIMRDSFDAMIALYPDPWNMNSYAYFACLAGDWGTLKKLLKRIDDQPILAAWVHPQRYTFCKTDFPVDPAFDKRQARAQRARQHSPAEQRREPPKPALPS